MSKRTDELARQFFGVEPDTTSPAVRTAVTAASEMLEQYGQEVREAAAKWHQDLANNYEKIAEREKAHKRPGKFLQADTAFKQHTVYAVRIRAVPLP